MKRVQSAVKVNSSSDIEQSLIENFKALFNTMSAQNIQEQLIEAVYSEDLIFEDSFHKIETRDAFKAYCEELYQNLKTCKFEFHDHVFGPGQAILTWTMTFQHPKLKRGKPIEVEGASHLRFHEQVYYHRDYFDGGQLLYEHIPILGTLIQQLKNRLK